MPAGDHTSPVFDFTSMDFASMRKDLIRYAQQIFTDEVWTDFNDSNEGTRLIELKSYAADLLSYNQNARVRETVVASLIRRQNLINIGKTFDYALKSASAAKTTLEFGIDVAFVPFVIPSSFKVSDNSGVIFQPDADVNVSSSTVQISATQGDEQLDEQLSYSNGEPYQAYQLAQAFMIDGTLGITVGGVQWSRIINFIEAGPVDDVYRIETDEGGITTIEFGDGINGKVPPNTQQILATYKTGGGSDGNLPKGTIERLVSSLPGVLSVTNVEKAEGGGPRQSLTSAKRLLPLTIKSNERAVTLQDYASEAAQYITGVLKASGVSGLYEAGGPPVILYVVPNGGGELTQPSAGLIVAYFRSGVGAVDGEARGMAGKRVVPKTAEYVNIQLEVEAYVRAGSNAAATVERVERAYLNRYRIENVDFADALDLQDAYNTTDPIEKKIAGLQRVFIRRFSIEPHGGFYVNKKTTGDGTVEAIQTSPEVERREWNVTIVSGVTLGFNVVERRLGTASQVFSTSIVDEQERYEFNELVGLTFQPRPQENDETWGITSNAGDTITVTPIGSSGTNGLLITTSQEDDYVINEPDPKPGKIIRTLLALDYENGDAPSFVVEDTSGWVPGDKVLVRDGDDSAVFTVSAFEGEFPNLTSTDGAILAGDLIIPVITTVGFFVGGALRIGAAGDVRKIVSIDILGTITVDVPVSQGYNAGENVTRMASLAFVEAVPFSVAAATGTVDAYWESTDGTVGFAVVNGESVFVSGDELYVDTFGDAEDIRLRPENYPLLNVNDLKVSAVGGVK